MNKNQASAIFYVGLAIVALIFCGVMLTLAWPIFEMPADRPATGYWDRHSS